MIQMLISSFVSNPRKLFLVDGIGAIITSMSIGLILASYHHWVGLSKESLRFLSGVAFVISLLSFTCYFIYPKVSKAFLKIIAIVNLTYCLMTFGYMLYFQNELTSQGFLYFTGEIFIISVLVFIEFKVATS